MHQSTEKVPVLLLYLSQKRSFLRYLIKLSGAGAGAAIRICNYSSEPEPKEIFFEGYTRVIIFVQIESTSNKEIEIDGVWCYLKCVKC